MAEAVRTMITTHQLSSEGGLRLRMHLAETLHELVFMRRHSIDLMAMIEVDQTDRTPAALCVNSSQSLSETPLYAIFHRRVGWCH